MKMDKCGSGEGGDVGDCRCEGACTCEAGRSVKRKWIWQVWFILFLVLPCSVAAVGGGGSAGAEGLLFVADVSGNWDLFSCARDGSGTVQLTSTPVDERSPAVSPDGFRVAYATSGGDLWIMTLATRKTARVSLAPGHYGHPGWLSDGSGIVFTSD